MSKIQSVAVQVEMFTTTDGKQFTSLERAEKHQSKLDFVLVIPADVEAFLNSEGETGRGRTMRANAIAEFRAFLEGWDGEAVELNAEKAAAKAERAAKLKAGAKKEEAPEVVEAGSAYADEDLL